MIVYTFLSDSDIQMLSWCDNYFLAGEPLKEMSLRAKIPSFILIRVESTDWILRSFFMMLNLFWAHQHSFCRYFHRRFGCAKDDHDVEILSTRRAATNDLKVPLR